MSRKRTFGMEVQRKVTEFDDLVAKLMELDHIFTASGYDAGGADEIIDDDLAELDMEAADLAAFHSFISQLTLFLENGTPAQYDYAAAIDAFRNMP